MSPSPVTPTAFTSDKTISPSPPAENLSDKRSSEFPRTISNKPEKPSETAPITSASVRCSARTTKNTGYAARGVEMLGKIRAAVKMPIVAIGGINEQNVTQVWQAGADSAAIISDILGADDIVAKTQRILAARTRD